MKKKKEKIFFVPIDELMPNPFQPRGNIDEDALAALASSIEQLGILQPICVTPRCKLPILSINSKKIESPSYNIIAGERRWRAARIAGLKSVPCIILDCVESDMAYMAFAENIFREDLTFFDIAVSLNDMLFMSGITQTDLAKKLAISQSAIANKLRLLKLTPDERTIILKNNLTERHARSLIRIDDILKRNRFLKKIIDSKWNAAETEHQISLYLTPHTHNEKTKKAVCHMGKLKDIGIFFNSINNAIKLVGTYGVVVERTERDCGDKIEILLSVTKPNAKAT